MVMVLDFVGCGVIEKACKYLWAGSEPKAMITTGRERREQRRLREKEQLAQNAVDNKA